MPERGCVFLRVDVYVSILDRDLPAERLLVLSYSDREITNWKTHCSDVYAAGVSFS